jgi:hypothetical protein
MAQENGHTEHKCDVLIVVRFRFLLFLLDETSCFRGG